MTVRGAAACRWVVCLALLVCALTGPLTMTRAQIVCGDVTDVKTLLSCSSASSVYLFRDPTLKVIEAGSLTSVTGSLLIESNDALTAVSFPALSYVGGSIDIGANRADIVVSFPMLSSVAGHVDMSCSDAILSTYLTLPVLSFVGGYIRNYACENMDVWWLANMNNGATVAIDVVPQHCTGNSYWLPAADVSAAHCCSRNPCQHGGTCQYTTNNYFSCACAAGFSGALCQTNINECASSPCANGGTCQDGLNSFTCACAAGFSGTLCTVCGDVTDLKTLLSCSSAWRVYLLGDPTLKVIEAGSLTSVTTNLLIEKNNALTAVSFPALSYVGGDIDIGDNAPVTVVSFPMLSSVAGHVDMSCSTDISSTYLTLTVLSFVGGYIRNYACQTMDVWWLANMNTDARVAIDVVPKHCTGKSYWLPAANVTAAKCCIRNPCQHGGTCQYTNNNYFSCACAAGFGGALCQTSINN